MLSVVLVALFILGIFSIPDFGDSSELHGSRRHGGVSRIERYMKESVVFGFLEIWVTLG